MLTDHNLESKVVYKDFSERKRVHLSLPIHLNRFFHRLQKQGHNLNRIKFDMVFKDLEDLKQGKIVRNKSGSIKEFIPYKSIKVIGKIQLKTTKEPEVGRVETVGDKVIVLFKIDGKPCRAEVPNEVLEEFELRMSI